LVDRLKPGTFHAAFAGRASNCFGRLTAKLPGPMNETEIAAP
jgi:hypothetical protein